MSGMFDASKTVNTKSAGGTKSKTRIVGIPGVLEHASFSALEKSIKAMKESAASRVKTAMSPEFIEYGMMKGAKPENFKGVEPGHVDEASSSCQLRARPVTSPLSPEEIALLTDYEFPMQDNVITVDTFVINPAFVNDEKILKKMESLLASAMKKGELPADLFMKQNGVTTKVLGEDALDHLFKTYQTVSTGPKANEKNAANRAVVESLLPVVGVLAITPKLADDDIKETAKVLLGTLEVSDMKDTIKALQAMVAEAEAAAKKAK